MPGGAGGVGDVGEWSQSVAQGAVELFVGARDGLGEGVEIGSEHAQGGVGEDWRIGGEGGVELGNGVEEGSGGDAADAAEVAERFAAGEHGGCDAADCGGGEQARGWIVEGLNGSCLRVEESGEFVGCSECVGGGCGAIEGEELSAGWRSERQGEGGEGESSEPSRAHGSRPLGVVGPFAGH